MPTERGGTAKAHFRLFAGREDGSVAITKRFTNSRLWDFWAVLIRGFAKSQFVSILNIVNRKSYGFASSAPLPMEPGLSRVSLTHST